MSLSLATKGIITEPKDIIITYNGIPLKGTIVKIYQLKGTIEKIYQLTGHIHCK